LSKVIIIITSSIFSVRDVRWCSVSQSGLHQKKKEKKKNLKTTYDVLPIWKNLFFCIKKAHILLSTTLHSYNNILRTDYFADMTRRSWVNNAKQSKTLFSKSSNNRRNCKIFHHYLRFSNLWNCTMYQDNSCNNFIRTRWTKSKLSAVEKNKWINK